MLLTGIKYVGKAWFIYLHKNMFLLGEIFMSLCSSCCYFAVSKKCCFGRFRDMKINRIRSQDSAFEQCLINNVARYTIASFYEFKIKYYYPKSKNSNEIRKTIFHTIKLMCNINSYLFDENRG